MHISCIRKLLRNFVKMALILKQTWLKKVQKLVIAQISTYNCNVAVISAYGCVI